MYNYKDIKSIHLEVTSKCQARCPMCPRRLRGGPMLDSLYLEEISLDLFKKWFPQQFIKQLNHVYMCGNLGDPMIAKDTNKIFRYMRETNPGMSLQMHTNGSGRTEKWWQELAELNVKVVFGIDGLQDTHSLYRINTDWNKIIKNAKAFIKAGGDARWDMLVFKHNEHQVEKCEDLSKMLGFKGFSVKHTTRFRDGKLDVIDDTYNITHTLLPSEKSLDMIAPAKKAAEEKLQDYRQEVEQHFAKTADLIDHLTDSYKDVFSHLSESAEHLLTEEQIKNQLLNRKAREVTLKYLKGDEVKDPSDPPNLTS